MYPDPKLSDVMITILTEYGSSFRANLSVDPCLKYMLEDASSEICVVVTVPIIIMYGIYCIKY